MARRRIAPFRIAQILGTVGINFYFLAYTQHKILYQGFLKSIPEPVLNCYGGPLSVFACPIGSSQQMIGQHVIPWLPLGIFIIIGAFIGRAACAWVCPFGLWQDLLVKIRVGPKAGSKRWVSFGVIAAIAAAIGAALALFIHLSWLRAFLYGWLPFTLLALLVILRGRIELPSRLWLGGFLTGVGLGLLVWLRFGASFGVVAGVIGMTLFGLAGRWFAAVGAAIVGFLVAAIGPAFHLGPLQGVALGAAVAVTAFLLVFILDRLLKVSLPSTMLKFAFLFLVAGIVAYKTGEPWFCKLCPQGTFEAGIPLVVWDPVNALRGLVGWLYWVKIGILLLVVLAAIAIKRPFCRLICPIGAVYSIFNKGSMLHMTFDSSACTDCKICRRICPTDIDPTQNANQLECIRCFECSWNCPKSGLKIKV